MKIYLVGGAVRDQLLGLPVVEHDYVVVGATVDEMLKLGYRQVGKEFPVFLHPKTNDEYALARKERKTAPGYQGFSFDTSPHVSLEDDLLRRDLTINAIAYDPETQHLIDPWGGQKDIERKVLRHVSPAFAEDPVRILRAGRLLARYAHLGFHIDPSTIALMRKMVDAGEINALVAERVWKECQRALAEHNPEEFFESLAACHGLSVLFPGLDHKGPGMQALKAACVLSYNPLVRFAALFHAYPELGRKQHEAKAALSSLYKRYRIPNDYRELGLMAALHYSKMAEASSLSANALLGLFMSVDAFRRQKRFGFFLQACHAISLSKGLAFDASWVEACIKQAAAIDVSTLIQQGLKGRALAAKIREIRREKIEQWQQHGLQTDDV